MHTVLESSKVQLSFSGLRTLDLKICKINHDDFSVDVKIGEKCAFKRKYSLQLQQEVLHHKLAQQKVADSLCFCI